MLATTSIPPSSIASGPPPAARLLRAAALAVFGSLLLWASAKIQVPFYPVPMTMQSAVVFLLGIAYGWRLAMATVLLYSPRVRSGLPVFAGTPERGIGLPYMMGPTGGYLLGFVAGGRDHRLGRASARAHWLATVGGLLAAIVVIYTSWASPGSPPSSAAPKAVTLGVLPFLLGELLKLALVTALAEAGLKPAAGLSRLSRDPRTDPGRIAEAATAPAPGRAGRVPDRDRLRPGRGRDQRRGGGRASTAPRAGRRTTR